MLHCFLLDCSASMRNDGNLARAKGLLLALMQEAYQRRDHVALLCFAGEIVELRLPPRRASAWNDDWIAPIAAGGGTPLALGVRRADQLLAKSGTRQNWLWLLTDGRSSENPGRPESADVVCVVDFEAARLPLHRARRLAESWDARYLAADGAQAGCTSAAAASAGASSGGASIVPLQFGEPQWQGYFDGGEPSSAVSE